MYEALLHIAQGLLDNPRNGLLIRTQTDAATLKRIYDNALILLYRLLFILFAEARELLPVEASGAYRDRYSLYSIKREVAGDLKLGPALLSSTVTLWPHLTELFNIINLGSPPLKVATFNGGLFDPERHPFLRTRAYPDAATRTGSQQRTQQTKRRTRRGILPWSRESLVDRRPA